MAESIFRKESLDKVSSPEQLNNYIKVSSPSVWLVMIAAIVLLASVLVWAVFGTLPTTVTLNGVHKDGKMVCYVEDVSSISVGDSIVIDGVERGEITQISEKPISQEDISALYADDEYTLYLLNLSQWNYVIEADVSDIADGVTEMQVVVDSVSPISFIMN